MSDTTLTRSAPTDAAIERVLIMGDLSELTEAQRVGYYRRLCDSLGLNPLTKPFDYLKLSGRLVLYAKRDATDQLRKLHGVSITSLTTEQIGELYLVTASATDATGRSDVATGVVTLKGLAGESLANAIMRAESKAKRRVTLSLCGLGLLDESEMDTIPEAVPAALPEMAPPAARVRPSKKEPDVPRVVPPVPEAPEGFAQWVDDLRATADHGTRELVEAWNASKPELRKFLMATDSKRWQAIKAEAAKTDARVAKEAASVDPPPA